ncbi:MAG: Plug domain-containing protein [Gemmatimonadota bacterium]
MDRAAASVRLTQVQTPGQDTTPDVPPQDPAAPPQDPATPPQDTIQGDPPGPATPTQDTIDTEPEFRVRNLPSFPSGPPTGWSTGVWEWDREGLRSTRALTLIELLEGVPGLIPLRGGDHGQPVSVSAFGVGAGRVRVLWDGVEMPPLDGGVVDIARVGLAALERVTVERGPGGVVIELTPLRFSDARPYSFLEVGTGDLDTNLFRGVFAHPDALGGSIVLALDRLDTAGPQRREAGVGFGGHLRHSLFLGERLGVAWEFRRMTSRRPDELWQPPGVQRSDWGARARYEVAPSVVAGVFFQRSSLARDGDEDDAQEEAENESLLYEAPRTQVGARLSMQREIWWAEVEYRQQWGVGWPSSVQVARGGGVLPQLGGASAVVERASWDDENPLSLHARVWSRSLFGFTLFGEYEDGRVGVPFLDMPAGGEDDPPPDPEPGSFTERSGIRAGVEYGRGDLRVGGALLSVEADSLHPTGLPLDREGSPASGGDRTGVEGSLDLPLDRLISGLSLRGSAQFWNAGEVWRYLPRRTYQGRISFHDVFLESGNLEVWTDVGVWGRDPMSVPTGSGGLATVPFHQSWFARLQIRVVSVRAFVRWENFTLRPGNQDFPGRLLPQTRVMYGIRWTMWN